MAKRTDKVEVIMPNGTVRFVPEHLLKLMTKFGGVPASDKTFRQPPRELLTALKKVVVPVLDEPKIKPVPEKITATIEAQYPGENVSAPIEAVTTQPEPDEPIKEPGTEKKVVRKTVKRKK